MFKHGKTAVIVAITLSVLGTAFTAFAGAKDDDGGAGGSHTGPLGQCFVPPNCGQERGSQGYQSGPIGFAYVPANPYRHHRDWHRAR